MRLLTSTCIFAVTILALAAAGVPAQCADLTGIGSGKVTGFENGGDDAADSSFGDDDDAASLASRKQRYCNDAQRKPAEDADFGNGSIWQSATNVEPAVKLYKPLELCMEAFDRRPYEDWQFFPEVAHELEKRVPQVINAVKTHVIQPTRQALSAPQP